MNHLPACTFVTLAQVVTNFHDLHVLINEICQIKVGLQRGGAVNRQSRNEDRHQNHAHLLLLLNANDSIGQDGETK